MAIADFNKDNPFVIIMRKKADELSSTIYKLIKMYIIVFIIILLSYLSYVPSMVYLSNGFEPILLFIFRIAIIIHMITQLLWIKNDSPLGCINQIIYGDEYKDIYINNELLLKVIQNIENIDGNINQLKLIVKLMTIFSVVLSIFNICYFIINILL